AVVFVGSVSVVFLFTLLPQTQRFFKSLFSWRILRRCLIGFAWLVTLIALFYGVANWHGSRPWNNYSNALIAQGEQLDFKAFIPKPVPDSENFAANPEVQSWFVRYTNSSGTGSYSNAWDADAYAAASAIIPSSLTSSRTKINDTGNPTPQLTDLVAWEKAFAAVQDGHANDDI